MYTNIFYKFKWRSGSTFTANLFNKHPDVFYQFEPLYEATSLKGSGLTMPGSGENKLFTMALRVVNICNIVNK